MEWDKTFIVAVVGVIVAIVTLLVAINSYYLNAQQTQITELENQPNFLFTIDYYNASNPSEQNNNSALDTGQDLIITNDGKSFTNFTAESICFMGVIYYNSSFTKYVFIPIQYYILAEPTTSPNGEFNAWYFTGMGSGNLLQFDDIGIGFVKYAQHHGADVYGWGLSQFVKVDYDDIYNTPREEDFYIQNSFPQPIGIPLSKDDWNEINQLYSNKNFYVNVMPTFTGSRQRALLFDNSWRYSDINQTIFYPWSQSIYNSSTPDLRELYARYSSNGEYNPSPLILII